MRRWIATACLLSSCVGGASAQRSPLGHLSSPVEATDESVPSRVLDALRPAGGSPNTPQSVTYPTYGWPFVTPFQSDHSISNYVDRDATAALRDFNAGTITYDTHRGTDIAIRHFRAMDRGVAVRAGENGTVVYAQYAYPDRSYGPPYTNDGNGITIQDAGGSYTSYWHFRTNSLAVENGEYITAGQFLGLVGSSGISTGPHLHFEPGEYVGLNWSARDPWNGSDNALPSLWQSQPAYVGTAPLRIFDLGVTNVDGVGGNPASPNWNLFKDGIVQPAVFGATEPYVLFWVSLQAPAGTSFTMEILQPNGATYASYPLTLGSYTYANTYVYWSWNGYVDAGDYGTWTVRIRQSSTTIASSTFTAGATTQLAPRFSPIAGRSFRITGATQRDTLRVAPGAGAVTYSLLHAPAFVSLQSDSVVVIGASSTQAARSLFFQARAVNGAGLADTMWYHVVDPTKPLDDITSARDTAVPVRATAPFAIALRAAGPSAIECSISGGEGSSARGDILGVDGRALAHVFDAALSSPHVRLRVPTASLPSGVYVLRVAAGRGSAAARFAVTR